MFNDSAPTRDFGAAPKKVRRGPLWPAMAITLFLALVLALIAGATYHPRLSAAEAKAPFAFTAGMAGHATGVALFAGAIVWLIFHFAAVRRSGRRAHPAQVGLILATTALGAFVGVSLSEMETAHPTPASAPYASRDDVTALNEKYRKAFAADIKSFDAEMDALGKIGSPALLAADPGLTKARAQLKKEREIIDRYEIIDRKRHHEMRDAFAALNLGRRDKDSLMAGFDREEARVMPLINQHWEIQQKILKENDAAVTVLASNRGAWRASGGKMIFSRVSVLTAFNSHITKLNQLSCEHDLVRSRLRSRPDSASPDLNDVLPQATTCGAVAILPTDSKGRPILPY
jgi:hypothetical protein